ncbi:hypothetical protein [Streptomyces sp. NPDC048269]
MGRTRTSRKCPPRAASALRPSTSAPAEVEAPETRRIALHGHG